MDIKWNTKSSIQKKILNKNEIQNLETKSVIKIFQIQKQNKMLGYKVCHENNGINSIGHKKFKYKISANRIMIT